MKTKKDSKQMLFEMMGKIDPTFKSKLNENIWNDNALEFEKYPNEFQEVKNKVISDLNNGGEFWNNLKIYDTGLMLAPLGEHIIRASFDENSGKFYGFGLGRKDEMSKYNPRVPDLIIDLIDRSELSPNIISDLETAYKEGMDSLNY